MIDFACKQFNLEDIIKCGLSLTRTEFKIMEFFISNSDKELTTIFISKKMNLNLTTIQKAVKKLFEKKIIIRHQKNLENGGYIYTYECETKKNIRKILKEIIRSWSEKVEKQIDKW
jgi:predicted transcriptional regulator